jgi:hypothetical protein
MSVQRLRMRALLAAICLGQWAPFPARADNSWISRNWSLAAFAGPVSHNDTSDVFTGKGDFNQGGLTILALSKKMLFLRYGFSIEAEGQVGQHFGRLHEQELNLVLGVRFYAFPWSRALPTSFAIYVGPSYEDWSSHGVGNRHNFENYFGAEVAVSAPWAPKWAAIVRYHHRSSIGTLLHSTVTDDGTMFGAGIKYRFP